MRIAQVAPPFEGIVPSEDDAAACVVLALTEVLVRRGHEVTLFAPAGTRTTARLVPVTERPGAGQVLGSHAWLPLWSVTLGRLADLLAGFDVVHSHLDHVGFALARLSPRPVVTTLHGWLDRPELQPIYDEFADVPLVALSQAQRAPFPEANWVATVAHGLPLDQYPFNPEPGSYLAYVGDACRGDHLAVAQRFAERANLPLLVVSRISGSSDQPADPGDSRSPHGAPDRPLDFTPDLVSNMPSADDLAWTADRLTHTGALSRDQLVSVLHGAAALIQPARSAEPSNFTAMQALACGTPVVALRTGGAENVVKHGITGFLGDTNEDLVHAADRLAEIDRARCRAEAERCFSLESTAAAYEMVYERLARGELPAREGALQLTQRQQEIVRLVAKGYTNRQIARALMLKEGTISNHLERIFQRLGASCRAQLAAWAVEHRLLEGVESAGAWHTLRRPVGTET